MTDDNPYTAVRQRVRAILAKVMLRRRKTAISNKDALPPKSCHLIRLPFRTAAELSLYQFVEQLAKTVYSNAISKGVVGREYASIFLSLLRMRRACCHPIMANIASTPTSVAQLKRGRGAAAIENLRGRLPSTILRAALDHEVPECCSCHDSLADPRVMACGHVICSDCYALQDTTTSFPCPACGTAILEADTAPLLQVVPEFTVALRLAPEGRVVPGGEEIFDATFQSSKLRYLVESVLEHLRVDGFAKICVFSQWLDTLRLARTFLAAACVPTMFYHGGLTLAERQAVLDGFWDEQAGAVLLISLKAGGVGLNLNCAHILYLLDPWWNPAVEEQAIDRVHRLGQLRPVQVYRLVMEGTVEERILDIQKSKDVAITDVLQGAGNSGRRSALTIADLGTLLK